jgi:hypothetical protein
MLDIEAPHSNRKEVQKEASSSEPRRRGFLPLVAFSSPYSKLVKEDCALNKIVHKGTNL